MIDYLIHLGDNALILGHRNSEWCGHGPVLEQDIAITNISLDLIGQARNFYQYAATLKNDGSTEDSIAYIRDTREFRNCLLVELPMGDWAVTILRQFFISNYQFELYTRLAENADTQLSAICAKALKEVTYHLRWSSEWVIRLGDGTEESKQRLEKALEELWPYTGELFMAAEYEKQAIDPSSLKEACTKRIREVFEEATITMPAETFPQTGGKTGMHTEHLGFILAEMQYLQRAYPNATW